MVDIYDYSDYRKFLSDLYAERKGASKAFSYRFIALKAGFASPSFFAKILKGETNISQESLLRLVEVFHLSRHQAEYFELLVGYDQARTQADKKRYFERIRTLRRAGVKKVESGQYEIFSDWSTIAIRALVDFHLFRGDYAALGRALQPPVPARQAKQAVDTLLRHGLVRWHPDGHLEVCDAVLTTGDSWDGEAVANYQRDLLELARRSYERGRPESRDMSTLTLGISASTLQLVKEKLAIVRREILEIARNDPRPDRVVQVNMQVFPVTVPPELS